MRLALSMFCVLAVCFGYARAGEISVNEVPKDLLGCWQKEQDDTFVLFLETRRCKILEQGQLMVLRAHTEGGKLVLVQHGHALVAEYELKDAALIIKLKEEEWRLKRRKEIPTALDPQPMAFGATKPLSMARRKAIQEDLAERHKEDQAVRTDPVRRGDMPRVDGENTAYLKKLVAEQGWIDCDRFGAETSNTAFLIVQHSGDIPLMMAALAPIEKDVQSGKLDPQPYALLFDRIKIFTGEKQRYGTQIGQGSKGQPVVLALEDKTKVEDFRKAIGLFPLSQYLDIFKQQTGAKEIEILEE